MLDRRNAVTAGLLLPFVGGAASAKRTSAANPLIGSWSLIDAVTVHKDGNQGPWQGMKGPYKGLIIYQDNGMMAVQIALPRAAITEDAEFEKLSAEQRLAYLDSYYAYYGRFEFDQRTSIVHHYVESALIPNEIGVHFQRKVALNGDVVTLTTIPNSPTATSHNVLRWRRV